MPTTNENALRDALNARHMTVKEVEEKLHIAHSTFWRKCVGITDWTSSEIYQMAVLLNLSHQQVFDIFFEGIEPKAKKKDGQR